MEIWNWFLVGAATWALAIILKVLADFMVQRSNLAELKDWVAAALSGIWSTLCELGLFALALWFWSATFADALVAALGAALAEFIMLLPAVLSAHFAKSQGKTKDQANWRAFFFERSLFMGNHLLSRALVWFGVMGGAGLAAIGAAMAFFAITETTQAYGQARGWDWLSRQTQTIFFGFLITIMIAEAALIVWWW
jgi:hypothetical protein